MSGGTPFTEPGYVTPVNVSVASVTMPTVVAPPPSRKTMSPSVMPRTTAESSTFSTVLLTLVSAEMLELWVHSAAVCFERSSR